MINANNVQKFVAESSAFENGCGLHAFASCLITNLQQDKIDINCVGLDRLLEKFKEYYHPHAVNLSKKVFTEILTNQLNDPVHAAVILSRPLRNLLSELLYDSKNPKISENIKQPGQMIEDEQIRILAKTFGIRTQAHGSFNVYLKRVANAWGHNINDINDLNRAKIRLAEDKIINESIIDRDKNSITQDEVQQKIRDLENNISEDLLVKSDHKGLPPNAPVLRLYNHRGNHWQRIINNHENTDDNIAFAEQNNLAFNGRPTEFSTSNPSNQTLEGIKNAFGTFLEQRLREPNHSLSLSTFLYSFERELLNKQNNNQSQNQNSNQTVQAEKSETKSNSQASVFEPLANICKELGNYLSNREGGKGIWGIFGLILNWIGQIFDIFKEGVYLAKEMKLPELFGKMFEDTSEKNKSCENTVDGNDKNHSQKNGKEINQSKDNEHNNKGQSKQNENNENSNVKSITRAFEQKLKREKERGKIAAASEKRIEKLKQQKRKKEQKPGSPR